MMEMRALLGIILGIVILVSVAWWQGWIAPKGATLDVTEGSNTGDIANTPPPEEGIVKRVIDAITIELESGHIVRYIGVRAPSVEQEIHCFGKEALLANESVIGKEVRLEEEPLLSRSSDGAWTRYVFFTEEPSPTPPVAADSETEMAEEETPDGEAEDDPKEVFVNERILEGGFGFPVVSEDMVYGERMLSAARFASATGKGMWSRCEIGPEQQPLQTQVLEECIIKGKVTNEGEKLYRTPDCPGYRQTIPIQIEGGAWFCAEDIATDAGFTKAPDCP